MAVPLVLGGTEVAHAFAYRIVYPQAAVRLRVLTDTGHGYLDWIPLLLGVGAAAVLVGLLSSVVDALRRRPPAPVPAWAFALLPVTAFTLQELLERWFAVGGFPWWMVEQPTFRVGLVLQLPFALLAYVVARVLLRVAERVAVVLRVAPRFAFTISEPVLSWCDLCLRPSSLLGGCRSQRGPPALPEALSFDG